MIDERFPSAAEVRAERDPEPGAVRMERDPEPGAVRMERDPEPVQHSFTCPDCTNRAPICPSCWDVPAVEAAGRCPCAPPEHVFLCPGRWGNFAACAPRCRVRPYVAWLHALGGCFARKTREDLGQPLRLVMTMPEGWPQMLGKPGGRCGDHCGKRLNVTMTAVRRGVYLYSPEHDPRPACFRCGEPGHHICEACMDLGRAVRVWTLAISDFFAPAPEGVPAGFRR